jgi:hypothetical protein
MQLPLCFSELGTYMYSVVYQGHGMTSVLFTVSNTLAVTHVCFKTDTCMTEGILSYFHSGI